MASVKKKRKAKMNRHKLKKLRKLNRHKNSP
ncbi:MAG: AURKAIP1/COX24 domain-containing protein [Chlamydiae bacterium]|nr:AURKAIP1/COX24 domain-containing protein [Chlamydiota bacterium]NBU62332.1 AURKAIP1/COX24 domain-containing protein [Chlamydiota bacterium]